MENETIEVWISTALCFVSLKHFNIVTMLGTLTGQGTIYTVGRVTPAIN